MSIIKKVKRNLGELSRELWILVKKYEPPLHYNGHGFNAVNRLYYYNELYKVIDEACREISGSETHLKCMVAAQKQLTPRAGDQTAFHLDEADVAGGKVDVSDEKVNVLNKENEDGWEDLGEAPELVAFEAKSRHSLTD
jgi:hypothetical protein